MKTHKEQIEELRERFNKFHGYSKFLGIKIKNYSWNNKVWERLDYGACIKKAKELREEIEKEKKFALLFPADERLFQECRENIQKLNKIIGDEE